MDMAAINSLVNTIDGIVWGPVMLVLLVGTGVYLTCLLKFQTWRNLPYAIHSVLSKEARTTKRGKGDVSPFSALMTALAATIGTGNIVGVATAMFSGGPGALVWMWISACFGLTTKFSECMLSIKYREVNAKGEMKGGPMFTMKNGFKNKTAGRTLGFLFALFSVIASFGIGNMTQANSISGAVQTVFGMPLEICGVILTILSLIIIVGGIKTISKVSSVVVPGMAVFYIIAGLICILLNIQNVPHGLYMIFMMAFNPQAIGGGGLTSTFGYAFVRVLGWTLVWAFFATFTTYIGGILLSLLLNSKKTRLPKMWRTLFIVTIAVPQFVSLLLVRNFFSNGGIVNTICHSIGLTGFLRSIGLVSTSYIPFLSAPGWAHVMIILINIWIGVPYQMLIATGVLMNLPSDQLESARVDGATNFQIFRKITMPYLLFVTGPALITDFVKNINNFNVIYLLTQDVYTTTNQAMASSQAKEVDLLVTWLFRLTQDYYNYKMASAIGIIVFIICAVFTLVAFNRMIKGDKEGTYQ